MTPHNPTVDYDNFAQSYRHHLRREISQISVWDVVGNLGVAGLCGWLAHTAHQHNSFFGAMAVGVVTLVLVHALWSVLLTAAEATVSARPWYGIGRTVHHRVLGACQVLDFDNRDEVAHIWVLIQPLETEGAAMWEQACELAESSTEIHAEGEGE